ncbi:BAR-domain-containing protein [Trichocladium antarcticum]|uniref:BAR-domain-containing protein n=1 Tax=Trichocladium antarcticum TaxID=1450529 RepID=A0AAN6UTM6_9PEZI|nr:BAR-domain-containing protein [Trichocladium antarcticum]
MNITKKFDRAFQWAGEKMGGEVKTSMSDDFKMLETEMALRFDGMERLQRSMNQYIKWMGRHLEPTEDKDKALPVGYLGRTMVSHGEEYQRDSEFGNCLITVGRANERVSAIQESFVSDATSSWLESLERSLAMMKEYQTSRKKLENRRLAYDASISKLHKTKKDDFRLEEELRAAKAKYEESSEDVLRRMQDIQDAEADSVQDLEQFLDAELNYHEQCAEELRRVRQNWPGTPSSGGRGGGYGGMERRPTARGRSGTAHSHTERLSRTNTYNSIAESDEHESSAPPVRMPARPSPPRAGFSMPAPQSYQADGPVRPPISKKHSFQGGASFERGRQSGTTTPIPPPNHSIPNVSALRGQLRPVHRIVTTHPARNDDIFADRDDDTASDTGSPDCHWGSRSTTSSVATSVGSLSRTSSNTAVSSGCGSLGSRKAPPPPPPNRAKKPPPPVPARRDFHY